MTDDSRELMAIMRESGYTESPGINVELLRPYVSRLTILRLTTDDINLKIVCKAVLEALELLKV